MQENYGITYEPPSWSEKFQVKKKKEKYVAKCILISLHLGQVKKWIT